MKKTNFLLGGALLLVALFTTSCDKLMSKLDNPVSPYLELEQTTANLEYGQSITIKPTSINDQNPIYTYESLNPEIATVDEATGVVTAVDYEGEATIVAKIAATENYQAGQTEFKVTIDTPEEKTPLSFEAVEDCKITVKFLGNPGLEKPIVAISNGVKQEITETTEIEVVKGQKVRFFSENAATAKGYDNNLVTILANEKECYIYGNVMSMVTPAGSEFKDNTAFTAKYALAGLFYKPSGYSNKIISHPTKKLLLPATTLTDYCYDNLFNGCSVLDAAPELPAEEMKASCYFGMFKSCKKLAEAPELKSTILADACYRQMFYGCEALTTAPTLPATNLASNCYYSMFRGCINLTAAPELPATTVLGSSYREMFYGCTSLTAAPELPATSVRNNSYYAMFRGCTNLATAPALPAKDLKGDNASACYREMFYGCTSLTTAPVIAATSLASNCYYSMFRGCTSLTTPPELPVLSLQGHCYREMFYGCTSLTATPSLPASIISTRSYQDMFNGCSNLSLVMCNATSGMKTGSNTSNWLKGVKSTGNFFKNSAAGTAESGDDVWNIDNVGGIPAGWNVYNL